MASEELIYLATIGLIFESFIGTLFFVILILAYRKYQKKKHRFVLYLTLIFLNLTFAVIFSWIAKLLVITVGLEFNHVPDRAYVDETDPVNWFLLRIIDFRISLMFITIAMYITYVLEVNLYSEGYNKSQRLVIIIYTIFTAIFTFFFYERENLLLNTIDFFLVFLLMLAVYIPLFLKSYKAYKSVEEDQYKKGFLSLALFSIFYILILLNFLIDRVFTMIPGHELGFSIFYFLAWIFCIAGNVLAYLGFIRPRSSS